MNAKESDKSSDCTESRLKEYSKSYKLFIFNVNEYNVYKCEEYFQSK